MMETRTMIARITSLAVRSYHALRIVLLWGVIAWLAYRVILGRSELEGLEIDLQPAPILLALLSAVLAYQLQFLGWISLLRRIGLYRSLPSGTYARIWWISFLYRYVPGKLMLVIERARRGVSAGIPYPVGATLPVIETLVTVLAGGIISLLAISYYARHSLPLLFSIAALALIVILLVPAAFRALTRNHALTQRFPELKSVDLASIDLLVLLGMYLVHFLLLGTSFFLIVRATIPVPWIEFPGICGVYALSHVISILVIVAPAGLGVREGALAVQLQRLAPVGISEMLAIGTRLWFSVIELSCLAVVVLCYRDRSR